MKDQVARDVLTSQRPSTSGVHRRLENDTGGSSVCLWKTFAFRQPLCHSGYNTRYQVSSAWTKDSKVFVFRKLYKLVRGQERLQNELQLRYGSGHGFVLTQLDSPQCGSR
jgi:hypothetical protein